MEETLRRELADLCQRIAARGWVANHDGNVSARLGDGRFLASPTALPKADITPEMLLVVDGEGKVVQGSRRVFSEIGLHLACYRARPDVSVVLHAHPPTATGWACAGESFFERPFMAEPVVSLGESIPLVGFMAPGAPPVELEQHIALVDAVLLANHGALTVAKDALTAFLRMELVEHLARIALVARQLGGPLPLPRDAVEALLEARRKSGLGPQRAPVEAAVAGGERPDVRALVQDALRKLG
jgi:L-fuculose-phosphate aldolase